MVADNPYLRCSGLLFAETSSNSKEILEMLKATGSLLRFASSERQQLLAWLEIRLGSNELRAIEDFIDQGNSSFAD